MAPFVTKTMSASRAAVVRLSLSPISAACLFWEIIVPGVTPHENTYTIRKTRKKLKIHLNLALKSFHIIIRAKRQKINT